MTLEEYNQLDSNFAHCSGANCERANESLHHTAHKMLAKNTRESYVVANPAMITGAQFCTLFEPDHKERYAWGISRICNNVRTADLHGVKWKVISCFGADVYYKVKQLRRAITEEEQRDVRLTFTEIGYDGSTIEFDRDEKQYPTLMRLARYE